MVQRFEMEDTYKSEHHNASITHWEHGRGKGSNRLQLEQKAGKINTGSAADEVISSSSY